MWEQIASLCLAHFLTAFDPRTKAVFTRDVVRATAAKTYALDKVDEFIDDHLVAFQQTLVDEFNERLRDKRPLRFRISDRAGVGSVVKGFRHPKTPREITFQNALNRVTPRQFEVLAAILLRQIGCTNVYSTPESHDQGVDAFGTVVLVKATPYGVTQPLTWIAQAKHYRQTSVSTCDVRELVGSADLLLAKAFSTIDERYAELRLRSYAPTAVALITTEEIPATVRRLAESAGVFVFAASDLYFLMKPRLRKVTVRSIRTLIERESKSIRVLA